MRCDQPLPVVIQHALLRSSVCQPIHWACCLLSYPLAGERSQTLNENCWSLVEDQCRRKPGSQDLLAEYPKTSTGSGIKMKFKLWIIDTRTVWYRPDNRAWSDQIAIFHTHWTRIECSGDIFEYYSAANIIKRSQLCLGPLIKKLINFMSDMAKLFSPKVRARRPAPGAPPRFEQQEKVANLRV